MAIVLMTRISGIELERQVLLDNYMAIRTLTLKLSKPMYEMGVMGPVSHLLLSSHFDAKSSSSPTRIRVGKA